MSVTNLNESVLQKEEVKQQVVDLLKATHAEIEDAYLDTIGSLTSQDLQELIAKNYWDKGKQERKSRAEIKPTEDNGFAYTVLVQAALHQFYPDIQVDGLYGEQTKHYVTLLQEWRNIHHQNDKIQQDGQAGPQTFRVLHTLLSPENSKLRTTAQQQEENSPVETVESSEAEYGISSIYSDLFHGKNTASGELYDKNKLTCAHKTLPFGTIIKVTRLDTSDCVEVRVNDRGPFMQGRVVELSKAGAMQIGIDKNESVRVKVEVLEEAK